MKLSKKQWASITLIFSLFLVLNSSFFWKLMYPIKYEQEVKEAAHRFKVDPFLILSIIKIESNFVPYRSSDKGAVGLMQLMPQTAEWAQQNSGLLVEGESYRTNMELNILLGSWYLSYLLQKYDGNIVMTIAAYNAGQGNVDRWLKEKQWDGSRYEVDQIPFGETRHYVTRVLYYYYHYKDIYREDFLLNTGTEK